MEDELIEKELQKTMEKKAKKTKVKRKKTTHWGKVYEQLRDEELKRLGYIKVEPDNETV